MFKTRSTRPPNSSFTISAAAETELIEKGNGFVSDTVCKEIVDPTEQGVDPAFRLSRPELRLSHGTRAPSEEPALQEPVARL